MARKKRIARRVRRFVRQNSLLLTRFDNWYVGVTNCVERRQRQHRNRLGKDLEIFEFWKARSARDAADIERVFLEMGMDGSYGGWNQDSVYIYVFKYRGPYA